METEKKTTTNAKATKKENVEVKVESKPKTTAKKTETKANSTPAAKKSASAPKTEKTAVVKENKAAEVKAAPKKEEVIKLHNSFLRLMNSIEEKIRQKIQTLIDVVVVLYIGLCNGAGWVVSFSDMPHILLELLLVKCRDKANFC